MSQTTLDVAMTNCYIAMSTASSTTGFFNMSGYANSIKPGPRTRSTGKAFTYDGDTGIIHGGKRQPLDLELDFLYTEEATGPYKLIQTQYEVAGGGSLWLRWCPKNSTTGDYIFTIPSGVIKSLDLPSGDPDSGESVKIKLVMEVPYIVQGTSA